MHARHTQHHVPSFVLTIALINFVVRNHGMTQNKEFQRVWISFVTFIFVNQEAKRRERSGPASACDANKFQTFTSNCVQSEGWAKVVGLYETFSYVALVIRAQCSPSEAVFYYFRYLNVWLSFYSYYLLQTWKTSVLAGVFVCRRLFFISFYFFIMTTKPVVTFRDTLRQIPTVRNFYLTFSKFVNKNEWILKTKEICIV